MATAEQQPAYKLITYNGQKARQYSDGAIRDSMGRILQPAPQHAITPDNAHDKLRRRQELRAATVIQAANKAVERGDYRRDYGDMAWVAAIAEAQYIKAITPDDPKSTAAANFLLEQAGLSAKQQQNSGQSTDDSNLRSLITDFADIARAITHSIDEDNYSYLKQDSTAVLDGSVTDSMGADDSERAAGSDSEEE